MPITWRNIDAPNLNGAARLLEGAGRQINTGLDGLNQIVQDRADLAKSNFDITRKNNTQSLLDTLAGYRDADALDAFIRSGELQDQVSTLGSAVDRAAVREAQDNRLKLLRDAEWNATNRGNLNEAHEQNVRLKDAQEGRSVATHAQNTRLANAQEGRAVENQNFTEYQRDRTRDKNFRSDQINEQVGQSLKDIQGARERDIGAIRQIYQDNGVPLVNGNPDFSQVDDATRNQILGQIESAGLGRQYATEGAQGLYSRLLNAEGMNFSPQEASAAVQSLYSSLDSATQMSPQQQAQMNNEISMVNSRFEKIKKSNPYVEISEDPFNDANTIATEFLNSDPDLDGLRGWLPNQRGYEDSTRETLVNQISDVLQNGLELPGIEGRVSIPPSIVKLSLTQKGEAATADSLEQTIRNYVTNSDGKIAADIQKKILDAVDIRRGISSQLAGIKSRYENNGGNEYAEVLNSLNSLRR